MPPKYILPTTTSIPVNLTYPSGATQYNTMLVRTLTGALSNTYNPKSEYSDGIIVPGSSFTGNGVLANETADNQYTQVVIDPNGNYKGTITASQTIVCIKY